MNGKNILLKKRIGCLLAAALLAGEIGSASMVAMAAPVETTQTKVESQMEDRQEVVELPEEYITYGEPVLSEPDVNVEELEVAKAQENIQEEIPIIRPVEESELESLEPAKATEGAEQEEMQGEIPMIFPESIPVLDTSSMSEQPVYPADPNEPGNSNQTYDYQSLSVNDVISGSWHNGGTERKYFTFTPEKSGYYGFYSVNISDCSLYSYVQLSDASINGTVASGCNDIYYTYSCYNLEAGTTYYITLSPTCNSIECSYEIKWIAFDQKHVKEGVCPTTYKQETILDIEDGNALYGIKVESEKEYDYELYTANSMTMALELKNGVENFFFLNDSEKLVLKKNVGIEDNVTITLQKVSATEYNLSNASQEIQQYRFNTGQQSNQYYSLVKVSPDEAGRYTVAVEKGSGIATYTYNDETKKLEYAYVEGYQHFYGGIYSYDANKTYYLLLCTNGAGTNNKVTASIKKADYIQPQIGTPKTYSGETIIPLKIQTKPNMAYRVSVEKNSDEQYGFITNFTSGSYSRCFGEKSVAFSGILLENELKVLLVKSDGFEQADDVTVTVEEYEIPKVEKDELHWNVNDTKYYEPYIAKIEVDKTTTYELCGIDYNSWSSYADIYVPREDNATQFLTWKTVYFNGSSFNTEMELEAGKTYYLITDGNRIRERGNMCFYLSEPKNYEVTISENAVEAVSCDMEILKAAEVSVSVPKAGLYELSANGGENHYEVSCPGVDEGLVLYKGQSKFVYFSSPGNYNIKISREFYPEDITSGTGIDQVKFSIKKSSSMESIPVYDGTEATEFKVTFREENDYNWYSFTPERDGCYSVSSIEDWYTYGDCDTKIYEVKEDHLQYIYYSNLLYELEGGKTYYVKLTATDTEGAHNRLVFLENPIKELTIDESEVIQTRHGALVRTNLEESGIYELTLVGDVNKKTRIEGMVNGSYYSWTLSNNKKVSKTFYLGKGEVEIALRKMNSDLSSTNLTIKLQRVDVQEGAQGIVMDKGTVWVKYMPTKSETSLLSSVDASAGIYEASLYYESENKLIYLSDCNLNGNDFYGVYDFKEAVTYYLCIKTDEVPTQFSLYIKPAQKLEEASLGTSEVEIEGCTQITYNEKATVGFYELKITGNTSPIVARVKTKSEYNNKEYAYNYAVAGGSNVLEIGNYFKGGDETRDVVVTLYNFSGEKTSAKVEVNKIDPVVKEISENESFTRTVEGMVEIYSFTPKKSSYGEIELQGIPSIELYTGVGTDWFKSGDVRGGATVIMPDLILSVLKSGDRCDWTAGCTYYFCVQQCVGNEISIKLCPKRRVYFYDYDEYSAFIASGGTMTIMNSADIPEDVREDEETGYSDFNTLGTGKVLVLRTDNFKNKNDRWYPHYIYSEFVEESSTTYGALDRYIDKGYYRGKKYEGLYNEALKKVNASDAMTNPHVAVVKYVPEYVAVQQIKLSGPTVMKVGDTAILKAVLDTMNEYTPTNATVTWSSSNSNVIAVNANGEITAKAPGTATITVKSNDKLGRFASIKIDVYQDVVYAKAVTISGPKNVYVGDSIQLAATVTGQNNATPTVNGVTWTTSDTKVARVDANGKVTGLKQGTVTITATSKDGKAAGTYTISVQNVIEKKITLNESKITMKKGTKYTWLKVTFKPENTTDKSLDWKSSNKKVVTVNGKGVLTAKGIGKATITATSANGKKAKVDVTVTKYAVKVKKVSIASKQTVMEGEKVTLPLKVTPVNATNQKMKWKSSNEAVATVNSKGVVTAKKAGKATITVTAQDGSKKSAKCVITVKELSQVKDVKVKSAKKKTVEISWAPVKDADGYVVYMATEKNGKYQKIATTKKDATSYTKTKLKSKKTYYFKVCAISKVGKKQYEGKHGTAMKVKVK